MANIITLTIKTDDSYTETEKVELMDSFVEFMAEMDPSIIVDSETVSVVNEDDAIDANDEIKAKAIDLIKNGTLIISAALTGGENEEYFSTGEVPMGLSIVE